MMFQLTNSNYYSQESNQQFMSVSLFKSIQECEAAAIAELKGEYVRPYSTALTVGSYIHAAFESDHKFEEFIEKEHDVIFKKRGGKYSEFEQADVMIQTLKDDPMCMFALTGDKEVVLAGEIGSVKWKIKVDNLNVEKGFFSDLKTTKSLYDRYWSYKYGERYVSFVHHYGYILQMAIYQEIIKQNTGKLLEPYIVAVTKETPPDKAIITFDPEDLQFEMDYVLAALPSVLEVKNGIREPVRCEKCAYCRSTKKIESVINVNFLLG